MMDTVSHIFFLMGTLLEIVLVGTDSARLDSLAWEMYAQGQKVVQQVQPYYLQPLEDETLRVSPLLDTLFQIGQQIAARTGDTVTPMYRTPGCLYHRRTLYQWVFQNRCVWDPAAYLKGWMVDRWIEGLPSWVQAAYVAFGGSSIRVRGRWMVMADTLRVLENTALGISASHRRGDPTPHLYARGQALRGTVRVVVEAPTAFEADVRSTYQAIQLLSHSPTKSQPAKRETTSPPRPADAGRGFPPTSTP